VTRIDRSEADADRKVTAVREALQALPLEVRVAMFAEVLEDSHVTVLIDDHSVFDRDVIGTWGQNVAAVYLGHDVRDALRLPWLGHGLPAFTPAREAVIDLRRALPSSMPLPDATRVLADVAATTGVRLTGSLAHQHDVKGPSLDADAPRVETQGPQPASKPGRDDASSGHATIPLDTPELVAYRDQILRRLDAKKRHLRERSARERSEDRSA